MKKILLIFAMLFTFSSSFISCRETANEQTEQELNNDELDVNDNFDESSNERERAPNEDNTEVPREEGVGEINNDL